MSWTMNTPAFARPGYKEAIDEALPIGQAEPEHIICCFLGCTSEAEFEIYGESRRPDDVTQACEAHVGSLLGTPIGLPENHAWTVALIARDTPRRK